MSSPSNIRWLSEDLALAVHEAQIAEHGGASGVRDAGLLASTLARPPNAANYADCRIAHLVALHALGITKNHPFIDGNKRVAMVLLEVFLEDNGYELVASDGDLFTTMLALAAGELPDEGFIAWVTQRTHPRA